jgi:thiamine pyrophosphokinase
MPVYNRIVPKKVLGVLAGEDMPRELLRAWAESADLVIAADAGADRLLEAGVRPRHLVGDLDSVRRHEELVGVEVHERVSQDATDCDKLLALAGELGESALTLCAIEGDRMDHALSTWLSAARSSLAVRIALRQGIGWPIAGGANRSVKVEPGRTVSLIPLSPCEGVVLRGVEWPLEGDRLSWDGLVSISNRAVDPMISVAIEAGLAALIVEVPRSHLPLWE